MQTQSIKPAQVFVGRVFIPRETYSPTEAEIVEFATKWDPYPWHIDRRAAEQSAYGGLTAPGVMIDAILIKLIHLVNPLPSGAFIGMIGVESARYVQPVRPSDELTARGEVVALRRSESNPRRVVAKVAWEITHTDGTLVYSRTNVVLCGSEYCAIVEGP